MEISIKNGEMKIIKTKESDITLHYSEKDKHSMNSFKSITSIEQQYNAMKRTKQPGEIPIFNFNKINCDKDENENVCKNMKNSLPQINFNNKYGQNFRIVGDIPKHKISKFIRKRNKYVKKNKDYPILCTLFFDSTSEISNQFMNIWHHIGDHLEDSEIIKLVAVNCYQHSDVCLNFSAIPHLQFNLQQKNEIIDYDGDLNYDDIMKFIIELLNNNQT